MKKFIVAVLSAALLLVAKQAMADSWAKTFGGTNSDWVQSVQQTSDGGYIVVGNTLSFGAGDEDFLVLKLNSSGNQVWAKTFGGPNIDWPHSVQQTSDGGYIVAGYTRSYSAGYEDFLVLKLNSSGGLTWAKTFGGASGGEVVYSVQQTSDGGYIVAGSPNLVIKLNSSGNQVWAKTFSIVSYTYCIFRSIRQTSDGGYIVAGYAATGVISYYSLVLKLDSSGNPVWAKTFSGPGSFERAQSAQQTSDGGYIVAGQTTMYGAGSWDFLLIKLNSSGNQQWARTFGGPNRDQIWGPVQQTSDGGYIVAGNTSSFGAGSGDFLVLKLNSSGNQQWAGAFGGTNEEWPYSVQQTSDGGYIVGGYTLSFGASGYNFLVLKIEPDGSMSSDCPWIPCTLSVTDQSLGANCTSNASSISLGADCTPTANSYTVSTSEICSSGAAVEFTDFSRRNWYKVSPNPFVQKTFIEFESSRVLELKDLRLQIYDLCGRLVKSFSLTTNLQQPITTVFWDGKDNNGKEVKAGVYFLEIKGYESVMAGKPLVKIR